MGFCFSHGVHARRGRPFQVFLLAQHMALLSTMGSQYFPHRLRDIDLRVSDTDGGRLLRGDRVLHLDQTEASEVLQQKGILGLQGSQKDVTQQKTVHAKRL